MRRQKYYQRRQQYQAATPRPIGNKNMLNLRIRNRQIKIRNVISQFRDVEVMYRAGWSEEWPLVRRQVTQVIDVVLNVKINSVCFMVTV